MSNEDDDRERGLYPKYRVTKLVKRDDGWEELPVDWVFVLNPYTDAGAVVALRAYIDWCWENGYDYLAEDLEAMLDT